VFSVGEGPERQPDVLAVDEDQRNGDQPDVKLDLGGDVRLVHIPLTVGVVVRGALPEDPPPRRNRSGDVVGCPVAVGEVTGGRDSHEGTTT